jgi:hypothetical protein
MFTGVLERTAAGKRGVRVRRRAAERRAHALGLCAGVGRSCADVTTWLPARRPSRDPADALGLRAHESFDLLIAFVRRFLDLYPRAAVWVEEPNPRRSDRLFEISPAARDGRWFHDEEVYAVAFATDDDARLAAVLSEIWPFPGWGGGGFLSRCDASAARSSNDLDAAQVAAVAEGVEHIICAAFDGEGYIVWSSPGNTRVRHRSL